VWASTSLTVHRPDEPDFVYAAKLSTLSKAGWKSDPEDLVPVFIISFTKTATLTGFVIKPQRIAKATLSYSVDGVHWTVYKEQGTEKVYNFSGVTSEVTVTIAPTEARFVKFTITQKEQENAGFNVALKACTEHDDETTTIGTTTLHPTTTAPPTSGTTTAPIHCIAPLEATSCLCHRTCDHMSGTMECPAVGSASCHKGCQCPAGTVMLNGTCVKETDCPCLFNGKFYKYADKIEIPDMKCAHMVCTHEGMKKMTDSNCTKSETCLGGRVFQSCPCERTCHQDTHVCDKSDCVPSCACPTNTVWNGKQCVDRAACACQEGNVTYTNGQSWDVGSCMKCHCVEGREQCSEICLITEEQCKKEGKKLFNKDLRDSVCCRCVTDQPHCMFENEEKAIGSVWHQGLCNTYACTKTADDVGMITMTKTECAACAENEDKEFVANKCCPICKRRQLRQFFQEIQQRRHQPHPKNNVPTSWLIQLFWLSTVWSSTQQTRDPHPT